MSSRYTKMNRVRSINADVYGTPDKYGTTSPVPTPVPLVTAYGTDKYGTTQPASQSIAPTIPQVRTPEQQLQDKVGAGELEWYQMWTNSTLQIPIFDRW